MAKKKKDPFAGSKKNYPKPPGVIKLPGGTILYPPIRQPALHGTHIVKQMDRRRRKKLPY
jgi:hypothetical protein